MAYDPNDAADKKILDDAIAEATGPLIAKRDELLGEKKKLQEQIRKGHTDPAAVERLEAQVEKLTTDLDVANASLKSVTKERDKITKNYETESGFNRKLLVDNGLTDALVSAKVASQFMPAVKAMLSGKVEIKTEGEARNAYMNGKPLVEAVTAWSQSDEGKHYVTAAGNTGGGSGGGGAKTGNSVTRTALEAMPPADRTAHFAGGGTVTDG